VFTVAGVDTGAVTPLNINFTITDAVGNAVAISSLGTVTGSVTIDNAAPAIDSVSVASSNGDSTLAKAGDTVTYTINYTEAVTAVVTTASTANNISTAVTSDVSALPAASVIVKLIFSGVTAPYLPPLP